MNIGDYMKIILILTTLTLLSSCSLARLDKTYNGCYKQCEFMGMELKEVRVDGSCVCDKCD